MFLATILIIGILAIVLWSKLEDLDMEPLAIATLIISGIFAAIALVSYPTSLDTVSDMQAFYEKNQGVYGRAVVDWPDSGEATTNDGSTTIKTIPYLFVEKVASYNRDLTWYRNYQKHWFIGGFVGKVAEDLEFITPPPVE